LRKLICFAFQKTFIRLLKPAQAQRLQADITRTGVISSWAL